jgi:hypothetical protein
VLRADAAAMTYAPAYWGTGSGGAGPNPTKGSLEPGADRPVTTTAMQTAKPMPIHFMQGPPRVLRTLTGASRCAAGAHSGVMDEYYALDHAVRGRVANCSINEGWRINRVTYDITSTPPSRHREP